MAALTIRSVTARPVLAPLPRPLRTASGAIPAAPLLLLDVETQQGVSGRAYVFGYTPMTLQALRAFVDEVAELLVSRPVAPADRASQLALAFRLLGRQGLVGMALSGLDMALWDALGRHQGRPVVELLGGTARPLPAYDSFGLVDPVEDRKLLEASVEAGFKAIKIKVGDGSDTEDAEMVAGCATLSAPRCGSWSTSTSPRGQRARAGGQPDGALPGVHGPGGRGPGRAAARGRRRRHRCHTPGLGLSVLSGPGGT